MWKWVMHTSTVHEFAGFFSSPMPFYRRCRECCMHFLFVVIARQIRYIWSDVAASIEQQTEKNHQPIPYACHSKHIRCVWVSFSLCVVVARLFLLVSSWSNANILHGINFGFVEVIKNNGKATTATQKWMRKNPLHTCFIDCYHFQ